MRRRVGIEPTGAFALAHGGVSRQWWSKDSAQGQAVGVLLKAMLDHQVHEMQGLYGPFTIAERVVQKIWLRRDFELGDLRLHDGRRLSVRTPGTWNLLGGPDFRDARLQVDGVAVTGDIEVHFHVSDWRAHRHATDRSYDNVILHVVLFPPAAGEPPARRFDGTELPTFVLLPRLHRSLEEYASDDALEGLTARDAFERIAELAALPRAELTSLLRGQAEARWRMKRHFAELRIRKLGWVGAAHHTALEILGYRHNRAAMLTVATLHPLAEWGSALEVETVFADRGDQWQLQGVRPANHPRLRLHQYQSWARACPDWTEIVKKVLMVAPGQQATAATTGEFRKMAALRDLRQALDRQVTAEAIGGTRLDTLICDGLIPLVAAEKGDDLFLTWFHWYLGDVPDEVRRSLATLGVAGQGAPPFCHGWAQGLLGWLTKRDQRASG